MFSRKFDSLNGAHRSGKRLRRGGVRAARGIAMVEFVIVALPLFLLGIVVIEVTRWAVARQAVNYALFEAARAGTVTGADPQAVHDAFERGMIPLLGEGQTDLKQGHKAVVTRLAAVESRLGVPGYRLTRVQPSAQHFDLYADPLLSRTVGGGRHVIDNRYLHERSRGRGAQRPTLMEANLLVLDLTYLHTPLFPGMRQLVRGMTRLASGARVDAPVAARHDSGAPTAAGYDTDARFVARHDARNAASNDTHDDAYVRTASRLGMLVIRRDLAMPMQTHPIEYRWERGLSPAENPRRLTDKER